MVLSWHLSFHVPVSSSFWNCLHPLRCLIPRSRLSRDHAPSSKLRCQDFSSHDPGSPFSTSGPPSRTPPARLFLPLHTFLQQDFPKAPAPELEKTAWAGRSESPMTTHTGCGNTGWTIGPSQRHTDSSFPFTHSPYNGLHKVPEYSPEALLSIKLDFQHSPSAGSRRVGHD